MVLADAVTALGGDRERVVKALTFLEEKGDLELQVAGVRQGYRVVRVPEDLAAVWHELRRRFAVRESSDIARVAAVAALVGSARQLARFLCGIASPALSTAKLTRHPLCGAAGEVPFAEVMAATKVALA